MVLIRKSADYYLKFKSSNRSLIATARGLGFNIGKDVAAVPATMNVPWLFAAAETEREAPAEAHEGASRLFLLGDYGRSAHGAMAAHKLNGFHFLRRNRKHYASFLDDNVERSNLG